MSNPTFVYTTYIRTTPEQLWRGLTDPTFTKRYWNTTFETDWKARSPMVWDNHGVRIDDPAQVVLESSPYTRLAYTWHTFTPEWAKAHDVSDEALAALVKERRTKVTFDIEPTDSAVRLTVTHDDFEPGSAILEGVSQGWPEIVSSLKTLLESGEPL